MIDTKEFFGVLAVIFCLINLGLYSVSILRRKTKPHAFSWLLWTLVMGIVCAAQYANDAGAASWQTGASSLMCLLVSVLAVKYGVCRGSKSDWASIIIALAAIPLWLLTKDALFSVILLTAIDAFGFYPTFRKGYVLPFEESVWRPFRATLSFGSAFLAVEHYNLTTALYPAAMILIEFSIGLMLVLRRRTALKP